MRKLLEEIKDDERVYVFTTHGHVLVGTLDNLLDEVVFLLAPDGVTRVHVNLADISGVRRIQDEPEGPR